MKEWKKAAWIAGIFVFIYYLPVENPKVSNAILEAFRLLKWYAVNHTLACVVPAMFIAGAISTFLSHASVIRRLGPDAGRPLAYGLASVSGIVLAVCSCSVLPMFAGIYSMGAGLGPASAFLYSGPAINVMAIFLSARVLGADLGIARAAGAVLFAIVIGLLMAVLFQAGERNRAKAVMALPDEPSPKPLWKTAVFFLCMILFLVFSDWYDAGGVGKPGAMMGFSQSVHEIKWYLAGFMGVMVLFLSWRWMSREEMGKWMRATWDFAMLIIPLLFGGVFVTGFVGGLLPKEGVAALVGGNGMMASVFASFVGTVWYFATLTEIPIVEMLMKLGMGKGPALALLLAGPALSLPSIVVIYKIIGARKTAAFCLLVVVFSSLAGWLFGNLSVGGAG